MRFKLKIPPVVQVLVFVFVIWLLDKVYPSEIISLPSNLFVAVVFIVLGIVMVILGSVAFWRAKTTVDPRYPDKVSALVVAGIYQYTRNPMYVGMLFSLMGVAVYFGNVLAVFILPFFIWSMNELQIKWEEQALQEKFGQSYQHYMNSVRRWL